MTNEHLPGCDCYDCLDKSVIGNFVHSKKPVPVYNTMGGTIFRTVKPGHTIGEVKAINSKGNWIYIYDPYAGNGVKFVNATSDLEFTKPKELTPEQKKQVVIDAIKSQPNAAGAAIAAGEKVGEVSSSIIKFLPKLKWIIIGIVVLLVLVLVVKIKS